MDALFERYRYVERLDYSMPRLVRLSFGLFAGVLTMLGVLLLSGQPVYPWELDAHTAARYEARERAGVMRPAPRGW
jgi:hypothetical protein